MLLLSTLLQISVHISNYSDDKTTTEIKLKPNLPDVAGTSPATDVDNLEVGGRHLITNEWWEGKLDSIPDSNDQDGDGIVDSQDSHPWDRNQGSTSSECASGCSDSPVMNVESDMHLPEDLMAMENSHSISDLGDIDGDGDLDLLTLSPYRLYFVPNEMGFFGDPIAVCSTCTDWYGYSRSQNGGTPVDLELVD